jgi:hypothetical protein
MLAELKAEALREAEWESDEEYCKLLYLELMEKGGYSGEELLATLAGEPVFVPNWY